MDLILFPHLERTGGSTVNGWFSSTFDVFKRNSNYFELPAGINEFSFENIDYNKDICFISGHFSISDAELAIQKNLFNNITIFTVLRHPVDRVVSGYRLWLRSPDWFPDLKQINRNFSDYYEKVRFFYSNNLACRRIAGSVSAKKSIMKLENCRALVGTTSHLDSFGISLAELLHKSFPNIHLKISNNPSNEGILLSDEECALHGLSSEMLNIVLNDNAEDLELFMHFNHNHNE